MRHSLVRLSLGVFLLLSAPAIAPAAAQELVPPAAAQELVPPAAAQELVPPAAAQELVPPAAAQEFERLAIPPLAHESQQPDLTGYLLKPAGGAHWPTVILMHGCDGLGWATKQQASWVLLKSYAERYRANGYAALILDSFAPRRLSTVCGHAEQLLPVAERAWDAFSAAHRLVELGIADPERLVLQGDSHGGWTVLVALTSGRYAAPEHFAAAVAFYPYCPPSRVGFTAPLLILIGDADDWTPADKCRALADRLRGSGGPDLRLLRFPGATHAFDFPYPERTNALGHHMRYDAEATDASWRAIDAFLADHVK